MLESKMERVLKIGNGGKVKFCHGCKVFLSWHNKVRLAMLSRSKFSICAKINLPCMLNKKCHGNKR